MRRNLAKLQQAVSDATDPRSRALAWYHLGVFHDNNGREAQAIPFYRAALRLGLPGALRPKASAWLASSLHKTGSSRAAILQCDRTLKMRCTKSLGGVCHFAQAPHQTKI
jgi:hypothetical protein